jgi:hypothetical protein
VFFATFCGKSSPTEVLFRDTSESIGFDQAIQNSPALVFGAPRSDPTKGGSVFEQKSLKNR